MPAAFDGLELVLIAVFLLLFGLLYALKWTVTPIIGTLHAALGWIPGAGSLVDRVDRAVLGAIDGAIHGVEGSIVTLCHGLVWSLDETWNGFAYFGSHVLEGLRYLHNTAIPHAINAVVGNVVADVHLLKKSSLDALRDTFDFVAALETKITQMGAHTYGRVVDNLPTLIRDDLRAAEKRAEQVGADALRTLKTAEDAAIANARTVGQAALDQLQHAEAVAADEVLHLPGLALDDIEKLLRGVDWKKLAGTLGAVPLVYALLHALEAETGLGNRECRDKVKQICSTDPSKWLHLLEGLVALGFAFNFDELVKAAGQLAHETKPLLDKLAA